MTVWRRDKMTDYETCIWRRNAEDSRWDTECDEIMVLWEDEDPWHFGIVYCPFCGKRAVREALNDGLS